MNNYIKLMNWFWQDVPYRAGYKSEYGIVFLAVVDLCNRNDWRETSAEYDRMINKVRVSKKMYYEAIKWLVSEGVITYKRGFNDYAPAKFWVKAEVHLCTSTDTTTAPQQHHSDTSTDTTGIPTAVPIINKPINQETLETNSPGTTVPEMPEPSSKPKTKKSNGILYPEQFEVFWKQYDKPTASKKVAYDEWRKLTPDDQSAAIDKLPSYLQFQPESKYRKDPERFFKHRIWENDFSPQVSTTSAPPVNGSVITHRPQAATIVR